MDNVLVVGRKHPKHRQGLTVRAGFVTTPIQVQLPALTVEERVASWRPRPVRFQFLRQQKNWNLQPARFLEVLHCSLLVQRAGTRHLDFSQWASLGISPECNPCVFSACKGQARSNDFSRIMKTQDGCMAKCWGFTGSISHRTENGHLIEFLYVSSKHSLTVLYQ